MGHWPAHWPLPNDPLVLDGPTADTNPVPGLEWATRETLPGNTSPCWGAANQTGNARLTMFKFDVLHLLPKLLDGDNNWTGRRLVNDADLTSNYDETGVAYGLPYRQRFLKARVTKRFRAAVPRSW